MTVSDAPDVLARFNDELPLADLIARQVRKETGNLVDLEDLRSCAREGLLQAARRYDADRGVSFRKFANYRVRGAVLDGVRAHAMPRRAYEKLRALKAANAVAEGLVEETTALQPRMDSTRADRRLQEHLASLATAMAIGLGTATTANARGEHIARSGERPDELAERSELMVLVHREMKLLPATEAALLRRHFFDEESLESIGRDLGLSKSWCSRILARAVGTLTKRIVPAPDQDP